MIRALALATILVPAAALADEPGHAPQDVNSPPAPSAATELGHPVTAAPIYVVYINHGTEPTCVETNDVVGYRECTQYGVWSNNLAMPPLLLDLAFRVRQLPLAAGPGIVPSPPPGTAARTATGSASTPSAALLTTTALRLAFGNGPAYLGLEGELGTIESAAGNDTPNLTGSMIGGYLVGGLRATSRSGSMGVEVAGGVRSLSDPLATVQAEHTGVLELRARGELWVGPWLSVGAMAGTSIVESGDWMAGVFVGVHSRAYGSRR
ncbi:MAG TPA: hypothetical protein VLX92_35265 [Kofleriaceae bacterium]|nr:hypothetical protein [Kofleriaceae bacterium]